MIIGILLTQLFCGHALLKHPWRIGISFLLMVMTWESPLCLATDSEIGPFLNQLHQKAHSTSESPWKEQADAVLIHKKETQWERYLKAAMNLPDWIDLGLENRTRFEVYDHPWRSSQLGGGGKTDPQVALRSRIRFGLYGGPFNFLFEGQDSRAYGNNETGDFVNTTIVNEWDILQVFGALTLKDALETGLRTDVHVGRLTLNFGSRRYIARNKFRNTTNAFDGFHWQIAQEKSWRIRAFLVEPVIRDNVKLDEQNKNRLFWGTYAENNQLPWLHINAFYFGLNDQRFQNKNLHRTFSTFGLRLFKPAAVGDFDYEFDGAIQTGHVGQTDHFAYNPNVEVGYTFNIPWTPHFLAQYVYASGTRTPGGSQSGTFDPLFGARRFDLMPTGTFGPFVRSNLSSPGWRIIVKPVKGLKVQLKHRFWYLAQARAVYVGGALQDPTGNSGNYLGHDVELRVQWAVSPNLDFDLGYDHWFKGSYFDRLPPSAGLPAGGEKDTDYFYCSMRVRL